MGAPLTPFFSRAMLPYWLVGGGGAAVIILVAILYAATHPEQPSEPPAPTASAAVPASTADEERRAAASARAAEAKYATERASIARDAFRAAPTAAARRKAYVDVLDLIKGRAATYVSAKGFQSAEADAMIAKLDLLERQEHEDFAALDEPKKPEPRPVPEYDGAYSVSGAVRQCARDGVILEAYNGKFYALLDTVCPDVPNLFGVVEDLGRTIKVDIGRSGREAKVVKLSDREKESDDRAAHRKIVADHYTDQRKEAADYQFELARYRKNLADANAAKAARTPERERLVKAIDMILLPIAMRR